MTHFETTTVIFGASTFVLSIIGWLLNNIINQHKALNKARAETTDTKFDGLIQRLDDLVKQIAHLFRDQEMVTDSIKNLADRLGGVETECKGHDVKCSEREKSMLDRFNVVHNRIDDLKDEMKEGGRRKTDPPRDRSSREN